MIQGDFYAQKPRADGNTGFSPELFQALTRGVPEVQKLSGDGVGVEENRIVPMTDHQAPPVLPADLWACRFAVPVCLPATAQPVNSAEGG